MENTITNAFRRFEHDGWQRVAATYDPGFGAVTIQSVSPLLDAVDASRGSRLLDVACGPGYVSSAAGARGWSSIVGVDFSPAMIEIARNKFPSIPFQVGDAEALDFPSSSFDAVVMNFGMLHLARPEQAINEAFRVLRPGGRYAFTVWDAPPKTVAFDIVLDAIRKHGNMNVGLPEGPPFFRFSEAAECERTLKAARFAAVQSHVVPQIWKLESGVALVQAMRRSAVRTAALLNLQSAEQSGRIEAAISNRMESFRVQEQLELPMPAVLTCAKKIEN